MELADIFLPHCFRIDIGETVRVDGFGEVEETDDETESKGKVYGDQCNDIDAMGILIYGRGSTSLLFTG